MDMKAQLPGLEGDSMDHTSVRHYTPEQILQRRAQRAARRRKKKVLQVITLACGAVLLLLLAWGVRTVYRWTSGARARNRYGVAEYDVSNYVFSAQDPRLILVNRNLPLPKEYSVEMEDVEGTVGVQLTAEAAKAFQDMKAAAAEEKVRLVLNSGYIDPVTQKAWFDKYVDHCQRQGKTPEQAVEIAQTVVQQPGYGEHQTGYAVDILSEDHTIADSKFAETKAFAWLERYAPDYGFILRYPEKREAATGQIFEPWHWRYVGVENAQAITASGLSLEEFLALHLTMQNPAA